MGSVSNDFMQDILIALGTTFGITCLVRLCCVRLRRRRLEQQAEPPSVVSLPFPEVIQSRQQHPLPSAPLQPMQQQTQPQYVVWTGGQYPTYPMNQIQQQQPQMYYMSPPVAQPYPQHV